MPAKPAATQRTRTPHASSRSERATSTRAAITAAALKTFAETGFAATRVEDIAARAGVAKGTIYLHFDSKEALFEAIIRDILVPAVSGLEATQPRPDEPTRDFAERVMLAFLAQILPGDGPAAIRLIIAEGSRFPALAEIHYSAVIAPGLRFMRALALRARDRGEPAHPALGTFPQLVVAPAILGLLWTGLFDRFQSLDVAAMLRAHLAILFPAKASG